MFGLGAILMQVLDKGGTLVIDEFGNSLHPFLSKEIIKIFQSKKQNPNNAQLVFSCHDTFLLSSKGPNLRRDQIWFTEKDKTEAAKLHSLAEYKTVEEIRKYLGATSLYFLSLEGLISSTTLPKENFCLSCFNGEYPIDLGEKWKEIKQPEIVETRPKGTLF
jgi:AAA15 family ATPase/GTPase